MSKIAFFGRFLVLVFVITALAFALLPGICDRLGIDLSPDPPEPVVAWGDKVIYVSDEVADQIESFMTRHRATVGKVTVDASNVDTIQIEDGQMRFDKPITVSYGLGIIQTRVNQIRMSRSGDGVEVLLNDLPINLRIERMP